MTEIDDRIAVIGMAVRIPGAEDTEDLRWMLTRDSVEVDEVPPSRWARELYLGDGDHQGSHHRGAFLQDPFSFDHQAFGMTAEDAVRLDPQQRMMLEVGARALEDSGYRGARPRLKAGVFVGARMNAYGFDQGRGLAAAGPPTAAALWGRSPNFIATWLSDRFDLSGPNLVVDTACSSSLTAVWLACQSLAAGSCELAVVGAVDLLIDPLTFVMLSRTGALSPDGLCHTFDQRANGYVPGEGAVALVLKPMATALADGDLVLGAIAGAAVNNDGRTMGVTTPNLEAQVELLSEVYGKIDPTTVQYLEAHGTGTAIGDPIEVQALTEVFGRLGVPRGSVALGSVKRRIGHLHSASGLTGLAKILTCLREGLLPGAAVEAPNPRLRLDTSPFHLPYAPAPWPKATVRRAGVSGFGFGGTNAHIVAEAVPETSASTSTSTAAAPGAPSGHPVEVLTLSADTPDGLRELASHWLEFLPTTEADIANVCATARLARPHRPLRVAVAGHDADALATALRAWLLSGGDSAGATADTSHPAPRTVAVLPAEAPAPPGWLLALHRISPTVREIIARFESATGTQLATFSGTLLQLCTGVALTVALRDLGLPEHTVELPTGWQPIADHAHGRATLEQALSAVLGGEGGPANGRPSPSAPGVDLCARLAGTEADTFAESDADAAAETVRGDERRVSTVLAEVVAELYASGQTIDWTAFQGRTSWSKRLLPAAQPRGPALDLGEPLRSAEAGSPATLDSDDRQGPGDGEGYVFSRVFGPGEAPLAQHSVHRKIMLPGVGWFDFLRQGAELRGDPFHGVRDVLFHRPLIPAGAVQVVCRVDGSGRFTVEDAVAGAPYVTGRYVNDPGPAPQALPVANLLGDCGRLHAGSGLYRWLRRIGYHHGRYYRNISWVAGLPGGGTLARIEGGRQSDLNPSGVRLFPGLLDSVTIAAIDPDNPVFGAADAAAFIPLSVERMQVFGSLADAAYVRTEVAFWNSEACRVTQVVTDVAGRVLLVFADISSKRVPTDAFTEEQATVPLPPAATAPVPALSPIPAPEPTLVAPVAPVAPAAPAAPAAPEPSTVAQVPHVGADARLSPAARALSWFLALTGISEEQADTEFLANFDSVSLVDLSDRLSKEHGLSLYPTVFFEYPTPRGFVEHLVSEAPDFVASLASPPAEAQPSTPPVPEVTISEPVPEDREASSATSQPPPTRDHSRDIAVVGAAVRVPTAATLEDFWTLLVEGRDTVRSLPDGRWSEPATQRPHASFLECVDEFDPAPFRISPREAPQIDPQARIVYETIWQALEDGGRLGERTRESRTGLWIAYSHDHYHEERARHGAQSGRGLGLEAMIPNRLSYLMDWHGPSSLVNTLCSSSLVALHTALQHLRAGDIDTAVIGGVHAAISPEYFRSMDELMALSPRHRCRAFDAGADGFVPGEGAAAVVLRRYEDAVRDGDRVHAVIKGSAVNHGGRTTRYSAPSPRAQRDVVAAALGDAGVGPESIQLVEAHGTGTSLGDPIEVEGLSRAWRRHTGRTQFCALGSLKSNIGHLEPAAGLAGLVKVLLALRHDTIPATLHVSRPNSHIQFEGTPFYLPDEPQAWPAPVAGEPRRAAVSAFGMGGVNAHVIIEEPPAVGAPREPGVGGGEVVRVSAPSEEGVRRLAGVYARHLATHQDADLGDFAFTANTGRAGQRYGTALAAGSVEALTAELEGLAAGERPVVRGGQGGGPVVFLFSGQGAQYPGMAGELYAAEPVFAEAVDRCAELLAGQTRVPVRELLLGARGDEIHRTECAQPALVCVQVALVELLAHWGVRPDLVAGHSLGELTAAWAAGTLGLTDLLRLTALRGRLMQEQPTGGAMAVVHAGEEEVLAELAGFPGVEIAAYNTPRNVTVSGPQQVLDRFCAASSFHTQRLTVSHAFHSAAMEGALAPFADAVRGARLGAPDIGFASTLTGTWHSAQSAADPESYVRAIRSPVRFAQALETLSQAGPGSFWEIGPHPVLTPLARTTLPPGPHFHPTLRRGHPDQHHLHNQLAAHHNNGYSDINWAGLHHAKHHQLTTIPTYPFHRQKYWIA